MNEYTLVPKPLLIFWKLFCIQAVNLGYVEEGLWRITSCVYYTINSTAT